MRKAFTIFVTKALILILKPFHRGTSFPVTATLIFGSVIFFKIFG